MDLIKIAAPVISHPATVYTIVLLLFVWAFLSGIILWQRSTQFGSFVDKARLRIEECPDARTFAANFEAIRSDLGSVPVIGPRWRDFCDSLIVMERPVPLVWATSRVATWFDLGLLRADPIKLDLRYHAALPNLLVGAGLLFTFLGLAAALSAAGQVVEGQASARTGALKALLDAASFKFITSLVGLFLSIIYALFRTSVLRRLDHQIDRFIAMVELRVPIITPVSLQHRTNELLERQASHLETFSTDLALGIGSALDRVFDHRLGEHIAPLTAAMATLGNRNEAAMNSMLDSFLQRLKGGAGDHLDDVAKTLGGLGESLEGFQAGLGDASTRLVQSSEALATRMGEGAEAALERITDQLAGLAESLRATADQTRIAGASAGQEMASRIEKAASGFEEASRNIAAALSDAAVGLSQRMGRQAEDNSAKLAKQFEGMLAELRSLAEASRATGQDALRGLAEQVSSSASGFERTVAKVAEALANAAANTGGTFGRGAEAAVGRIAEATEGMRSELLAMLSEFRGSLGKAGNDLRQAGEAGAASLKGALDAAGMEVAGAVKIAADRLAEAGNTTASSLERGGEAASANIVAASGGFADGARALASRVGEISRAGEGIVNRLVELDKAARDAAQPLTGVSTDLKTASQTARAIVELLNAISQTQARSIEQIAGATQRLEAAGSAAAKLLDGMTVASRSFEGVDRELAHVLAELQSGLRGFTQQVTDFVGKTDQNLAQAATQLGNLVKNLQNAVEELIFAQDKSKG